MNIDSLRELVAFLESRGLALRSARFADGCEVVCEQSVSVREEPTATKTKGAPDADEELDALEKFVTRKGLS